MRPLNSTLLLAGWLLLIPSIGHADIVIDRNNLQQLKDAIREMNEAPPPRPPRKAPKRKAPAAPLKPPSANQAAPVPTPESLRPEAKPALPASAADPLAPGVPPALPAAEDPARAAADIRAKHEQILRESPSIEEDLRRKHDAIVGNSPSMKEALERKHQEILAPPSVSPSPAAAHRP